MAKKKRRTLPPARAAVARRSWPLEQFLVVLPLLGVLALGPFYRGLFFPGEQLVALAVVLATFAGFYFSASLRGCERPRRLAEWAALALALCYWLALPGAVAPRDALGEALKYTSYLAVLWMVSRLGEREVWRWSFSLVLTLTALGVAVLGWGAAAGTFSYPGAFEGGRICSSLQYPNTAATYLSAGLILGTGLAAGAHLFPAGAALGRTPRGGSALPRFGPWVAAVLAGALSVMFLAFVFTMSRGGWLVFPVLVVILAALLPRGQRWPCLSTLAAGILGGLAVVPSLGRAVAGERGAAVWVNVALAFALACALKVAAQRIERRVETLGRNWRWVPVVAALLGLAVWGGLVLAGGAGGEVTVLMPQQLRQRLALISLGELGAQERLQWSRDALRLVVDRPLLGAGGGGWNALYGTVQKYPYFSTETHNHYAQVWVEAGTVGFLAFLAFWAGLLLAYGRARSHAGGATGAWLAAAFVAAGGLGAHAFIDFNLSLPAVALSLWTLVGLVAAAEPSPGQEGKRGRPSPAPWWLLVGVPLVIISLLFLAVSLRLGYAAGQRGARALEAGKEEKAASEFRSAQRLDPWTASYHVDLAQAYERLAAESGSEEILKKAQAEYRRGVELQPYDFRYRTLYGRFLLRNGALPEGMAQLREAVRCRPAVASGYENLVRACVLAGEALADHGQPQQGREYLAEVEEVARQMVEYAALAPSFAPADRRLPATTPRLELARGQAALLLGDLSRAAEQLSRAVAGADTEVKAEASLWLAALARLQGKDPAPYLTQADALEQVERILARARVLTSR